MTGLADLEPKAASLTPLDRAEAERVQGSADLVTVGTLGEAARRARHGERVTWVRVCQVTGDVPPTRGDAREVRIVSAPSSPDEAARLVREAARLADGVPLTGFSLADLLALAGGDHLALFELARVLRGQGLEAVAAVPVDRLGEIDNAVEAVRAVTQAGLRVPRATIDRAPFEVRLDLIERTAAIQRETTAFEAFAPLPEIDPPDQPSTGYDDVRTIALARLCTSIPSIQVSWPLYGPKLAQVALTYGADDLDGVAAYEGAELGRRRSTREDIERQIRAAAAEPAERDGRFEFVP